MTVSVVTTVYPENNSDHIECIAHNMAEYGADDMILIPYEPKENAEIELGVPDTDLMAEIRIKASKYITISDEQASLVFIEGDRDLASGIPKPSPERPNVAVVSSNGMEIDLHLGEASRVLIYGPREDGLACLLGSRSAPEPGGGGMRWESLANTLSDCFALLVASAGENPRKILNRHGVKVLVIEDTIDGTVDVLYGGGQKKTKGRK
jgi:nitrogen fixation protein NifB